jgi:molybdopterin-biosynthesis enzyme MoeA-like protein
LASSKGCGNIVPFTILFTVPSFFSKTKISSGPKNAMLVGNLIPLNNSFTFKVGSLTKGKFWKLDLAGPPSILFKMPKDKINTTRQKEGVTIKGIKFFPQLNTPN